MNGFISLQPTLSYFLNHRLQQDKASLEAIQSAFRQVYDIWARQLVGLMESKEPQEKQTGQLLTHLEYENLSLALQLALMAQVSIFNPYLALSRFLDSQQAQQQGLELGLQVLQNLENYPQTLLQGQLGYEFVSVLDDIAMRQLLLKHYAEAEQSYLKALSIWEANKSFEESFIKKISAGICHQLGRVAQEQRQWQQAEAYYSQALAIMIEFNDRFSQARTYHQLGSVAQQQSQWQQAEAYYSKALAIKIEFNDRYSQASTYHNLGSVAQEQSQWRQAETYYSQALAIYIEFNDRFTQASTYHQLGILAQVQSQWRQAEAYYLKALAIFVEFQDEYSRNIALGNINRLYHHHADNTLAARISEIMRITEEEALAILQQDLAG